MRIGKRDRSTQKKKGAISSIWPPKITHDPIWDQTRATTACYISLNWGRHKGLVKIKVGRFWVRLFYMRNMYDTS
jgi:hypothetical protein